MNRLERQLSDKLASWSDAGLITANQVAAIRTHESHAAKQGLPWGILIFAGFGSVVLGLGVILLFAYNWQQMHKFVKLGLVFFALAAAHGAGLMLRRRRMAPGFIESAHLLGTMLFGAGIWLVAQIYHISAHYPNAFLVWACGALLLAWVMPSIAHGLMAALLLTIWSCAEWISFSSHLPAAPLLVMVGTVALAWRLRSPVLLVGSAIAFCVTAVTGLPVSFENCFLHLLALPVLLSAVACLAAGRREFPSASRALQVMSAALYYPLIFLLTFHDIAEDLIRGGYYFGHTVTLAHWVWEALLPVAALLAAGVAICHALRHGRLNTPEFRARLLAPTLLLLICTVIRAMLWGRIDHWEWDISLFISALATLVYLYHTIAKLWVGCRQARIGKVVGGSLLMAALVFARYIDLFDSLLARGVMFIVVGAVLFAVAIIYHRGKKKSLQPPVDFTLPTISGKEQD